jgi:phosphatidylserine decarboxylase
LFSVGAKSVASEPGLFVRNERFVTLIEMDGGGLCAVVMVAAIGVGHVTVSYDEDVATHRARFSRAAVRHRRYDDPKPIRRGEELGIFHLGSTTIVVFEPGRAELGSFAAGEAMKMGIGIGRSRATNEVSAVPRG